MFTPHLTTALYHLKAVTTTPTPQLSDLVLPQGSQNSDDIETYRENLDKLRHVVSFNFGEWNRLINVQLLTLTLFIDLVTEEHAL